MASMWELLNEREEVSSKKFGLYSLDIETTGVNSKVDNIWSIGLDNYQDRTKSLERFIGNVAPRRSTNVKEDFITANTKGSSRAFGQGQLASGAFDSYFKAVDNNELTTVSNVLNEMSNTLKQKPGIVLIQNAPFETSFFGAQTGNPLQGVTTDSNREFSKGILGYESPTKPIFMDPRDRPVRDKFQKLFHQRFTGEVITGQEASILGSSSDIGQASKKLEDSIVGRIRANAAENKSTVADLMDFSKMYLVDLHLQGGIDSNFLRLGQNVAFLADTLLGVKESHTALMDAEQQSDILMDLTERRHSIAQNGLQQKDYEFIEKLTSQENTVSVFKKSISSELQSLDNDTFKKQSNQRKSTLFQMSLDTSKRNHSQTPTGSFDKQAYLDNLSSKYKAGASIEELVGFAMGTDNGATSSFNPSENGLAGEVTNKSKINSGSLLGSARDTFNDLSGRNKLLALGAGVLGVGSLGSGPQKSKEDIRRKTEQSTYNELYDNVYAGQAYADWTVRNQANKMIY